MARGRSVSGQRCPVRLAAAPKNACIFPPLRVKYQGIISSPCLPEKNVPHNINRAPPPYCFCTALHCELCPHVIDSCPPIDDLSARLLFTDARGPPAGGRVFGQTTAHALGAAQARLVGSNAKTTGNYCVIDQSNRFSFNKNSTRIRVDHQESTKFFFNEAMQRIFHAWCGLPPNPHL